MKNKPLRFRLRDPGETDLDWLRNVRETDLDWFQIAYLILIAITIIAMIALQLTSNQ